MKKLLSLGLLSMVSFSSIAAEWKEIVPSIFFVDMSRLTNNEIWVKEKHIPPKENNFKGKLVYTTVSKFRYSCKSNELASLQSYDYSSSGDIVDQRITNKMPMSEVVPDSFGEFVLKTACSLKAQGFAKSTPEVENKTVEVGNKQCDQIMKDSYYYNAMSKVCYGRQPNLEKFFSAYLASGCSAPSDSEIKSAESAVSNAILKKAKRQGVAQFCENEKSYFNKLTMKYNSNSL